VAGQDGFMDEVLGQHRLAEPLSAHHDDVVGMVEEIEGEDPFEGGPVERGRPVPVPIGDRFEAAEARAFEPAFDAAPLPVLELGRDHVCEEHGRTPALAGSAGDEVVEVVGRAREPEAAEVIRQGRRRGGA